MTRPRDAQPDDSAFRFLFLLVILFGIIVLGMSVQKPRTEPRQVTLNREADRIGREGERK
jgi:hypothetical protein